MVAVAGRLFLPGPALREVWLTFGLSVLFHAALTVAVVMVPQFQVGTYIKIPVSYTVSLVDAPPGGGRAGAPSAALRPAPVAAPPVPAAAARPAPAPTSAPRPAPTEELTLPSPPTARKPAPPPREPSVRPPSVSAKETTRPVPPTPAPMAPAAPAAPATPVAPTIPVPPPVVVPTIPVPPPVVVPTIPVPPPVVVPTIPVPPVTSATAGAGIAAAKTSGVEVAGTGTGAASGTGAGGGSAMASYLTLVDWKIQQNWVPVGAGASAETVVVIRFRVLRSGQVRDLELETSSGSAGLDASALRAVRRSQPLPPFPNLLTEPSLDLRYRFVMERG